MLTAFTGSEYFPGGVSGCTIPAGSLKFESGPTQDVTLEWATYYDAADQAGISRLYGGIHIRPTTSRAGGSAPRAARRPGRWRSGTTRGPVDGQG